MATLVCFHAHPDDEAIATGGLMAKAAEAGHRVVLVSATRGELGEPQPGVLADGEPLWERRMAELDEAARILGADPPRWLGYEDSGMEGEATNDNPRSFGRADLDEAAGRLAAILDEVGADVLTIYDDHGVYGHPDHVRVHEVGIAAARAAGVGAVYEATMNRDRVAAMFDRLAADAAADGTTVEDPDVDLGSFGTPADGIAYRVDVGDVIARKRAAMAAHRSQIGPDSFFLSLSDADFLTAFGEEWYNLPDVTATGGPAVVDLLPGLT
jgi:LmbE family N-acetylglucosaminyl deacetylase